jgi:predicted metal-dependent hydrolase
MPPPLQTMTDREQRAAFARGLRLFNAREFWHSHESWEAIWLTAPQPDKTFLQGIIQIAAAFYHHQKKNYAGMRSLMRRGLVKMEQFPAGYRGLRLEELRRAVRDWLAKDAGGEALPGRYPRLRRAQPAQLRR